MSSKAKTILKRYEKRYVTDEQLARYHELGVITDEEYIEIYQTKHVGELPEDMIVEEDSEE